ASATRLALAQSIGAELEASEIESAWTAFREPNCFSTPRVELQTKRRASPGALSQIKASVLSELERLQSRCGSGTQPLNVTVAVDVARISEDDRSVSAAQALPGVELETEEIYYEEVPYTEVEEVTTFDVTLELVERRDCAPRPGQRGCRTWTEEVEKKIPRVERREVEKIRRVERRRPLPGPFPKDKAVRFDKRVVSRQVQLRGEMRLLGEEASARFSIQAESSDESHPAVNERGVSLAADPLEVKSTEAVLAEAGKKLSETVRRGLERAVGLRGKELRLSAVRLSQEGKKLPAEENFLKKLVIGGDVDPDMTRFYTQRYGRPVSEVLKTLLIAIGRAEPKAEQREPELFPTDGRLETESNSPVAPEGPRDSEPVPSSENRDEAAESEELRRLEQESLEAAQEKSNRRSDEDDTGRAAPDAERL
ncbi:MAG: hypothetical protein AAFQ82_10065, partial [Myxococcota bacterium]